MKKVNLIFSWALVAMFTLSFNAAFGAGPKKKLKKANLTYEMVLSDGTNASAVAWNSRASNYVTIIAGNATFPCEVFSTSGKAIAQGEAGFDWRGLWFNTLSGHMEGNGAGEGGWASMSLAANGGPDGVSVLYEGQYQPDFQSVGAYDNVKNQVVFLDYESGILSCYDHANPDNVTEIELNWEGLDLADMNSTTVGFTGKTGFEFVLLDYNNGKLVFFDRAGKHTASSKLPSSAPLNDMFAFSFTNGTAFLYDKDARIWSGYKVF